MRTLSGHDLSCPLQRIWNVRSMDNKQWPYETHCSVSSVSVNEVNDENSSRTDGRNIELFRQCTIARSRLYVYSHIFQNQYIRCSPLLKRSQLTDLWLDIY